MSVTNVQPTIAPFSLKSANTKEMMMNFRSKAIVKQQFCCLYEMRIVEEYFNQLNPSYQAVIKDLEQKLDECNNDKDKESRTLLEFAATYLMPKEYWKMVFDSIEDHEEELNRNSWKAYYHFYYDPGENYLTDPEDYSDILHKTLKFMFAFAYSEDDADINPQEEDLTFPHSHLFTCFTQLESQSNRPLPSELIALYQMNKQYYEKICAAEEDVEEWFKLLCDAAAANDDEEIVIHNVEYRLGSNLLDKELWKLSIEYLRERDPAEMLQVYSKYCRFFVDDTEMKEKYKQEVQKYGPVYVPWKNAFDFEEKEISEDENNSSKEKEDNENNEFESEYPSAQKCFQEAEFPSNDDLKVQCSDIAKLCKEFYETYQNQEFPFMAPFISYIMDNANLNVLRKLYATCKYFFARKQVPIIHRFTYTDDGPTEIIKESIEFGNEEEQLSRLNNAYIATVFNANNLFKSSVSIIISRLYRCDAKYIYLQCGLSFDEIRFLIESGNAVVFYWTREMDLVERMKQAYDKDVNHNALLPFYKDDEATCNLEDILCYMPKIEDLEISPVRITSQTFTKLLNQRFLSKICSLKLYPIHGKAFDFEALIEFCAKNRATHYILRMYFHTTFTNGFLTELENKIRSGNKSDKETLISIH